MTTGDGLILQAALALAANGVKIVMLGDAGTERGKVPRTKAWKDQATSDEDKLCDLFSQWPKANIGVLLGPESGLIDVEFDSDEGRATADRIFQNTITPTYESTRSVHRLFKWNSELPPIQKLMLDGLEIRLGGGGKSTQSVLPPSLHPNGTRYRWLDGLSIFDVEPAELPEGLAARICNAELLLEVQGLTTAGLGGVGKPAEEWEKIESGVGEGERNNAMAAIIGRRLSRMTDDEIEDRACLEEAWLTAMGQNLRNKPPLDEKEVRSIFQSILGRERQGRAARAFQAVTKPHIRQEVREIASGGSAETQTSADSKDLLKSAAGFSMTVIEADPPVFLLRSPLFQKSGGKIRLTAAQVESFKCIRTAALAQAFVVVPKTLSKKWDSILATLVATADHKSPDPELHRPAIIAETILEWHDTGKGSERSLTDLNEFGVQGTVGVTAIGPDLVAVSVRKLRAYLKADSIVESPTQTEIIDLIKAAKGELHRGKRRWWLVKVSELQKISDVSTSPLYGEDFLEEEAKKRERSVETSKIATSIENARTYDLAFVSGGSGNNAETSTESRGVS